VLPRFVSFLYLLTFPCPSRHTFTHRAKTEDIFFDPEYRFPDMGPGTGLKRLESMVRTVAALRLSLSGGLGEAACELWILRGSVLFVGF
jgi:hypothetical protein